MPHKTSVYQVWNRYLKAWRKTVQAIWTDGFQYTIIGPFFKQAYHNRSCKLSVGHSDLQETASHQEKQGTCQPKNKMHETETKICLNIHSIWSGDRKTAKHVDLPLSFDGDNFHSEIIPGCIRTAAFKITAWLPDAQGLGKTYILWKQSKKCWLQQGFIFQIFFFFRVEVKLTISGNWLCVGLLVNYVKICWLKQQWQIDSLWCGYNILSQQPLWMVVHHKCYA